MCGGGVDEVVVDGEEVEWVLGYGSDQGKGIEGWVARLEEEEEKEEVIGFKEEEEEEDLEVL